MVFTVSWSRRESFSVVWKLSPPFSCGCRTACTLIRLRVRVLEMSNWTEYSSKAMRACEGYLWFAIDHMDPKTKYIHWLYIYIQYTRTRPSTTGWQALSTELRAKLNRCTRKLSKPEYLVQKHIVGSKENASYHPHRNSKLKHTS